MKISHCASGTRNPNQNRYKSHKIIWFNRADKTVHKNIILQLIYCSSYSFAQIREWCICKNRNNVRKLFHTWINEWRPHGICLGILYMDSVDAAHGLIAYQLQG